MKRRIIDFDHRVTAHLQGRPAFLLPFMTAASFLGLPVVVGFLVGGWVLAVFGWHQPIIIIGLLLCFAACGLTMLVKLVMRRQRPVTLYAKNMRFQTYSFPSGHSFSAFVLYGFVAYLTSLYATGIWVGVATVLLSLLIVIIGLSRIYLGAHYALDVLGGWIFGGIMLWAIVVILGL